MTLFESIADRRIREARRAGLFDNLPGAGKPIADLGQERPAGWWAARTVKLERDKMRYEDLTTLVRKAMPGLWRLNSEIDVRETVDGLNERINAYNARTSFHPCTVLDTEATLDQWRTLKRSGSKRTGSA